MNARSKQVLFLLLIVLMTFFLVGLTIWQVNRRFMAEKSLNDAETKWEITYGDGKYDELKKQIEDCQAALQAVEDETAALSARLSSDEAKITAEMSTIDGILAEIRTVLAQSEYSNLYDDYLDLQTRFSALNEKYEALKGEDK